MHTFFAGLRQTVREHPLLSHPYLLRAERGELAKEELCGWARQEYFVSLSFPRLMATVVANIPDELEAVKYPLVRNTFEELGGEAGIERSHPALLRQLIRGLGGTERTPQENRPLDGTAAYLDALFRICREGSFLEGLGAIGHGNEYLVVYEYGKILNGMRRRGWEDPTLLAFFTVNIEADVGHTEQIERAMAPFVGEGGVRRGIETSAQTALDARIPFYDSLSGEKV